MYAFVNQPARLGWYYAGRVARAWLKRHGGKLATGVAGAAALTGATSAMVSTRSRSQKRTGMQRGRSRTRSSSGSRSRGRTPARVTPGTRFRNMPLPQRLRFSSSSRSRSRSRSSGPPIRRGRPPPRVTMSGQDMVIPRTVTMGRMRRFTWGKSQKSVEKYVLRYQGMKRYNQGIASRDAAGVINNISEMPGWFTMEYDQTATGGSSMPCHLFSLTGIRQRSTYPSPHTQLKIQDDGTAAFSGLAGCQSDGSTLSPQWQLEKQTGGDANADQYVHWARNEWFDIRLCLYGTLKQAVKWTIEYGYFDSLYDPGTIGDGVFAPFDVRDRFNAWWQNKIAAPTYHPQLPKPCANVQGIFHTLWRKDYVIQPITNDEIDGNPNSRMVRFYLRDGRVIRYNRKTQRFTSDLTVDNGGWMVQGLSDWALEPFPRARRYLIITATNTGVDTSDGFISKPSYDMCVRKCVRPVRS